MSEPSPEPTADDLRRELDNIDRSIIVDCDTIEQLKADLRNAKARRLASVSDRRRLIYQLNEATGDVEY